MNCETTTSLTNDKRSQTDSRKLFRRADNLSFSIPRWLRCFRGPVRGPTNLTESGATASAVPDVYRVSKPQSRERGV